MTPSAVIVGAGAIGGWMASLLHRAGWEVRFLARGETLAAIQRDGLVVEGAAETTVVRGEASADPAALGRADYVILAVKAQTLPALIPALKTLVVDDNSVVSAMNGIQWWFTDGLAGPLDGAVLETIDAGGVFRGLIPKARVIGSVVHASCGAVAPGRIQVAMEDKLTLGELDGRPSDRVSALAAATRGAGLQTIESPDIRLEVWRKLWGNMCFNPISALTLATSRTILDDPFTHELLRAMMVEMSDLGDRLGLPVGMSADERMDVTRKLGDFKTSMLRDVEAGRPLELDPLLGVLVEMAERMNHPAPNLRTVYGLTRLLDRAIRLQAGA